MAKKCYARSIYIYDKWPECQALPVSERLAVVSLEVHANAREGYELMYCIVPLSLKVIALLAYIIF